MGFQRVVEILDKAVGGPEAPVRSHGAFWRGVTRDQFVVKSFMGLQFVVVGDGAASNLVKALKGQAPFDDNPPNLPRMPKGRPPVSDADIAVIEQWIDDGCPEESPAAEPTWHRTNTPDVISRTDDIWFTDPDHGWAVNSNGEILHTEDGGASWVVQHHDKDVYWRCIGFASPTRGWAGTLGSFGADKRLFETSNGGKKWTVVTNLPELAPFRVCGLSVVNESVVYASGSNFPREPARVIRTVDGGASWQGFDLEAHATLLVDIHFVDADNGWVVGGRAVGQPIPNAKVFEERAHVQAVVLRTRDGGATWTDQVEDLRPQLRSGEWGWKIHFLDDRIGYVALESFERGAILKTVDGGESWTRLDINDLQGNANLEGVGFLTESVGWVGGWGPGVPGEPGEDPEHFKLGSSSATIDGGANWQDAKFENDEVPGKAVLKFVNRFRFFREPVPVGYASGRTVYKFSAEPPSPPVSVAEAAPRVRLLVDDDPRESTLPLQIPVEVPSGAGRLTVALWDRFGRYVRRLVDEPDPAAGSRIVEWDGLDDDGQQLLVGQFIIRVTVDDHSESQIVQLSV